MKQTHTIIRKVILLYFIIFLFDGLAASAQQVITLQKAVALALDRNLTIKQSQIDEALGAEDVRQAKADQLPTLSINPQGNYYWGKAQVNGAFAYSTSTLNLSSDASVGITLFQGGQLRNQVLENKMILDADKTSTAKVKNDLILNVVVDYLQILTNQDLVSAAKEQIGIAKLTLDNAQKNFDAGNQTLADLSQAKAGLSTAELNLTTAQNQVASTILTLKQYMEMSPDSDIIIEKPDISKINDVKTEFDANEVIKTSLGMNPDVRLAEQQQQAYAQAIKVAKGAYYPSLVLGGGVGSSYSSGITSLPVTTQNGTVQLPIGTVAGTGQQVIATEPNYVTTYVPYNFWDQARANFNQFVGINLQIPIFNHSVAAIAVKKAKLNYEYAQLSTELAKDNLVKTVEQALLDLKAAEKSYISAQQTYQSNKDAFNVIQQRYNVGLVNSLDYNTALTNYNKAETDMIEAKYTLIFRSKVIDYYLGNTISL